MKKALVPASWAHAGRAEGGGLEGEGEGSGIAHKALPSASLTLPPPVLRGSPIIIPILRRRKLRLCRVK